MNDQELISKVQTSMNRQCHDKGYATAVDVLMDTGILSKQKHEDWRYGRIPFLEAVCQANLSKLALVLRTMHQYAENHRLKESFTYYKRWGAKKQGRRITIPLRFSRSGNPEIEKKYATHYVDPFRTEELKKTRQIQAKRIETCGADAEEPADDHAGCCKVYRESIPHQAAEVRST